MKPEQVYFSDRFVIAAGTVLFRKSPSSSSLQVCLLFDARKSMWVLPKGRKDQGEEIRTTALRETFEETGYECQLVPVRMSTRAPFPGINTKETVNIADSVTEPIAVTIRQRGEETGIKCIWWYISKLKDPSREKLEGTQTESEEFTSTFVDVENASEKLTYPAERDIVKTAFEIVRNDPSYLTMFDG